jgi:exopolysaccharide biosynthesis polyprenyl glycosylphosphotransferase
MFKKYHVFLIWIFFTLDIAITIFSLILTDQIYPILPNLDLLGEKIYIKRYIYLVVALIWAVAFRYFPMYGSKRSMPLWKEVLGVSVTVLTSWTILIGSLFLLGIIRDISRPFLILFGFLNLVLLLTFHISLRILLRILRLRGYNLKKVLIIGAGPVGQMIAKELLDHPWTGFSVIGFLDDNSALYGQTILSIPVLGGLSDIREFVEKMEFHDEVIIALPAYIYARVVDLVRKIEDIPVNVRIVPDFFSVAYIRPNIEDLWGIPLIGIRNSSISPLVAIIKRLLDIVIASIAIVLCTPLVILIAFLIKIFDPDGPIFFVQKRIGENGKPFKIYKFRTMTKDAEEKLKTLINLDEMEEPVFKLKDDPRITSIGRYLRRYSLDELPQLINVLKGEMSLVGPRPEEASLVDRYNSFQRKRLIMKPGITGPVQVNGRGDLSLKARVELENEYIENHTLMKDFEILIKTISAVIRCKGSY